jgi:hypothetical protein
MRPHADRACGRPRRGMGLDDGWGRVRIGLRLPPVPYASPPLLPSQPLSESNIIPPSALCATPLRACCTLVDFFLLVFTKNSNYCTVSSRMQIPNFLRDFGDFISDAHALSLHFYPPGMMRHVEMMILICQLGQTCGCALKTVTRLIPPP